MMQQIPITDLEFEPSREEILLSRIVDGEAFEDDWIEFEALASADASLWQRLARAQREQDMLVRDVQDAVAIAELIGRSPVTCRRAERRPLSSGAVSGAKRFRTPVPPHRLYGCTRESS